jgi:DNA (cytosine-5)-methyltransferase 1
LRNLIKAGLIADGEVDERSIEEVQADELKGFTQCHFFAGIGGWSYAARLAGWDDDRPLWTGSCPCQPFSAAGKQRGTSDERHLWPVFYELIRQSNPPVVFGEQVASRLGRDWLAGVRTDLETVGYAVGAADLCAASVGAPHIRQRLWWVADSRRISDECGSGLGEAQGADRKAQSERDQREWGGADPWRGRFIYCADGKARRLEPSIEPLAHGVSNRVGRLRAYGNAIVPQVAAEFIKAVM